MRHPLFESKPERQRRHDDPVKKPAVALLKHRHDPSLWHVPPTHVFALHWIVQFAP